MNTETITGTDSHRVGQYEMVTNRTVIYAVTVIHAGINFRVILYGAYNELGFISSKRNGIAILDTDNQQVVLDEHAKSGTWASDEQLHEFVRIIRMDTTEFLEFINSCNRLARNAAGVLEVTARPGAI